MAWTTPKTWGAEVATSTDMNTYVRDNLSYLFARPAGGICYAGTYTRQTASWAAVDTTNLRITKTITSGQALIIASFCGYVSNAVTSCYVDVAIDGTRVGNATYGLCAYNLYAGGASGYHFAFAYIKTGISAGSHDFDLYFYNSNATYISNLGAGLPICFAVLEV